MKNILVSEWTTLLTEQAEKHGGKLAERISARWESSDNRIGVSLELTSSRYDGEPAMEPRVHVGVSACLSSDPLIALADLKEREEVIHKALRAYTPLARLVVWFGECPCDSCGGKGTSRGSPCRRCEGCGTRREPEG